MVKVIEGCADKYFFDHPFIYVLQLVSHVLESHFIREWPKFGSPTKPGTLIVDIPLTRECVTFPDSAKGFLTRFTIGYVFPPPVWALNPIQDGCLL